MAGDRAGIMIFGKDINQAGNALMKYFRRT